MGLCVLGAGAVGAQGFSVSVYVSLCRSAVCVVGGVDCSLAAGAVGFEWGNITQGLCVWCLDVLWADAAGRTGCMGLFCWCFVLLEDVMYARVLEMDVLWCLAMETGRVGVVCRSVAASTCSGLGWCAVWTRRLCSLCGHGVTGRCCRPSWEVCGRCWSGAAAVVGGVALSQACVSSLCHGALSSRPVCVC